MAKKKPASKNQYRKIAELITEIQIASDGLKPSEEEKKTMIKNAYNTLWEHKPYTMVQASTAITGQKRALELIKGDKMNKEWTEEEKQTAQKMWLEGKTYKAISEEIGRTNGSIASVISRWRKRNPGIVRKNGPTWGGKSKKTTEEEQSSDVERTLLEQNKLLRNQLSSERVTKENLLKRIKVLEEQNEETLHSLSAHEVKELLKDKLLKEFLGE